MQGHAYRGCQLDLDETREKVVDLQARLNASEEKNAELRVGMKKIQEVLGAQKF